jgi:hypothetical protein
MSIVSEFEVAASTNALHSCASDARLIFQELYQKEAPNPIVVTFISLSNSEITWAEILRRPIKSPIGRKIIYDLRPKMRINLALSLPFIPIEVVYSTLLEELVHLYRGWDIKEPHDAVFWKMVLRYRFFSSSMIWKEKNAGRVLDALNQNSYFGFKR